MLSLKKTLKAISEKINKQSTSIATLEDRQVYSTSEKVVGTWIDGKPIYRKSFSLGNISAVNYSFAHGIANISEIVNLYGRAYDGPNMYPLPYVFRASIQVALYGNTSNIELIRNTSSIAMNKLSVTIEYTKTTD